jgi:ribonuclease HIII
LIEDYVNRIEEACGEEKDTIVLFKHSKKEEAIKKILSKMELEKSISNILFSGKFKDKKINLFKTGKLVIKGIHGKKEIEDFLNELLI